MRPLKSMFATLVATTGLHAHTCYVPANFQHGETIEQLVVICDVDGVVRDSVESKVDGRVVEAVKALIQRGNVHVTFLSGTPAWNDQTIGLWRRGNIALDEAFGSAFNAELVANKVDILGAFGGQKLRSNGSVEPLEELPLQSVFAVGQSMICSFLRQVVQQGNYLQQQAAQELLPAAEKLQLKDETQYPAVTATEFEDIALEIRQNIDPRFRLLSNICVVEVQMSPFWDVANINTQVKASLASLALPIDQEQQQVVSGRAKRGGDAFDFILFGTTNKGTTSARIIAEKQREMPKALIVTIGDTQGDFPMHVNADLAFHVGRKAVWEANQLAQCVMIQSPGGKDSQHVEGTLYVLKQLQQAMGGSFDDLRYVPHLTAEGAWELSSLRELRPDVAAAEQ